MPLLCVFCCNSSCAFCCFVISSSSYVDMLICCGLPCNNSARRTNLWWFAFILVPRIQLSNKHTPYSFVICMCWETMIGDQTDTCWNYINCKCYLLLFIWFLGIVHTTLVNWNESLPFRFDSIFNYWNSYHVCWQQIFWFRYYFALTLSINDQNRNANCLLNIFTL